MKYLVDESNLVEYKSQLRTSGAILPGYHFYWEEVMGNNDEGYRDLTQTEPYRDNIILLAIMLEEFRNEYGRPMEVTSWFRPEYYNNVVLPEKGYASSTSSDHLEARAVDVAVPVTENNINLWKIICRRHGVFWSYGLYDTWMHLGFRFDHNHTW